MAVFDFYIVPEITGKEGGLSEAYLAPVDWFTTIQEPPSSGSAIGETATIDTAHVFAVSTPQHGFLPFTLIPGKEGKWNTAREGEYPNQKNKVTFEWALVGLSAAQIEFMKQSLNVRFIALLKDGNCGNDPQVWNLGCECRPVIITKVDYDSETNILTIGGETFCAPALYDVAGAIPIEDDTP